MRIEINDCPSTKELSSAKILAIYLVTLLFWKNYLSALQELSIYRTVLQPCSLTNLCISSDLG